MKIHLKFTCLTQANNSYTATVKNTSCINKTKHECRKHKKQLKAPSPHPPSPTPLQKRSCWQTTDTSQKNVPTITRLRGYFRMQRKHQTCSKRVSYLVNLVIQIDLILQNWWGFKVWMTVGLNKLSSCMQLLWDTALFTISHFLPKILENLW